MAKNIAIAVLAYLGVGAAISVWTVHRGSKGQPVFDGIGKAQAPAMILAQNIVAWPYALVSNLTKKG